jgi:hypothetical protein
LMGLILSYLYCPICYHTSDINDWYFGGEAQYTKYKIMNIDITNNDD